MRKNHHGRLFTIVGTIVGHYFSHCAHDENLQNYYVLDDH